MRRSICILCIAAVCSNCFARTKPVSSPSPRPAETEMIELRFPENVEVKILVEYVSRRLGMNPFSCGLTLETCSKEKGAASASYYPTGGPATAHEGGFTDGLPDGSPSSGPLPSSRKCRSFPVKRRLVRPSSDCNCTRWLISRISHAA